MSTNKQVVVSKRRLSLAIFSVALICSLVSGSFVYVVAQGSGTTFTISSGVYPGAPSYTIYTDGSTYYAKDAYGVISWSSTNASYVRQMAYNVMPDYGTLTFVGNFTFDTALTILKPINYIHEGVMTLSGCNGLIFGDSTHFVKGGNIKINEINGVNNSTFGLVFQDATTISVYFNKIKLCATGIYFNPVGTGCGENRFYGGWITACNIGVDFAAVNTWMQGNFFLTSIYACSQFGMRLRGLSEYTSYIGVIDNLVGVDPDYPTWGGGVELHIYSPSGKHNFLGYWFGTVTDDTQNSQITNMASYTMTIPTIQVEQLNVGAGYVTYSPGGGFNATDRFSVWRTDSGKVAFEAHIYGESLARLYIMADGKMQWGTLGGAPDTNLYRGAAGILSTDGLMKTVGLNSTERIYAWRNVAGDVAYEVHLAGENLARLYIMGDGKLQWGTLGGAPDTTLYRNTAGELKTDGIFLAAGGYKSADGSTGVTQDINVTLSDGISKATLHFKNGLYVGATAIP